MGKKRSHAETRDGFTKPSPDGRRLSASTPVKDRKDKDKKDKRRNGEVAHRPSLVCRIPGSLFFFLYILVI